MSSSIKSLLPYQPIKTLYLALVALTIIIRLPLWLLTSIFSSTRLHHSYTLKQNIMVHIAKIAGHHASLTHHHSTLTLAPGAEGDRFERIKPSNKDIYKGVLEDAEIKPAEIGGTWYPDIPSRPSTTTTDKNKKERSGVILHLHGGAFVDGDGRPPTLGFGASLLTKHTPHHIFAPQYRLASSSSNSPHNRFPAALQDALTAYTHLLHTHHYPPSQIILSGDSAGGNLVVALLRYIIQNPATGLPRPKAALLWAAWLNPSRCLRPYPCTSNRNYTSDYLEDAFGEWGVRAYAPPPPFSPIDAHTNPYVSPLKFPFRCEGVPIWCQFGSAEVLADDICQFAEKMRGCGNEVGLSETGGAPHDVFLLGGGLGFEGVAEGMGREMGGWLRGKFPS
ncbi:MAG: hypothetical protein LQ350_002659 [Teloschistes chrysophthalmus]|nr:MAG: hypothetical protein LQ350_002659 [Niorma chrysophthalma]